MKKRRKSRPRPRSGDVYRIDLGDGRFASCQALRLPLYAFFDSLSTDPSGPDPAEIVHGPVLFKVWVMSRAITSGRWVRIGAAPVRKDFLVPERFFKQDDFDPRAISIYCQGEERPATFDECTGLECAAVWDAEHVEDRLRDHYAGRPNPWVESMRLVRPPSDDL